MLLDTPSAAENRRLTVVALEFWRDYEPDRENPGNMRAVDWVRWARRGDLTYATNEDKISRISKPMRAGGEGGGQEENPVWLGIRGAYEAWKSGQETPVDGTPLDAWPALTKVQVEAFRAAQYRTIEDVAEITDGELGRVRLPDMRQLREQGPHLRRQQSQLGRHRGADGRPRPQAGDDGAGTGRSARRAGPPRRRRAAPWSWAPAQGWR